MIGKPSFLSAFDLDHTLVRGNSSLSFCRYLFCKRVLPLSAYLYSGVYLLQHRFFHISLSKLHQSVFRRILFGKPLKEIEKHVENFLQQYLFSAFYPPAISSLKLAQHLGHYTVILSNSPSFLVKAIAQFLGVNEWHATEYNVDKDAKLCKIAQIIQGEDKAKCIGEIAGKLGIVREAITAYSDSFLDLQFLQAAGNPIAVNPDKKLRAFSQARAWNII